MKFAIVLLPLFLVSLNAQAVQLVCQKNESPLTLQLKADGTCFSDMYISVQGRSYCVSKGSKALKSLKVGSIVRTCTAFIDDATGNQAAYINQAVPFTAE